MFLLKILGHSLTHSPIPSLSLLKSHQLGMYSILDIRQISKTLEQRQQHLFDQDTNIGLAGGL